MKRPVFLGLVIFSVFMGLAAACGGSTNNGLGPGGSDSGPDSTKPGSACVPGQQVTCGCPGGEASGVQVCTSDGQGYGPCTGCAATDGAPGADGSPSSSGGGTGGDAGLDASGAIPDAGGDGAATDSGACPPGLLCNASCEDGGTTTVTGVVVDPAGRNPVFDVEVYVPAGPLSSLPRGISVAPGACLSCATLFPSAAVTSTVTAADGSFTLKNVPAGSSVPLVLQIGKWRRRVTIPVTACQPNAEGSLTLLAPPDAGTSDDTMPDIAVSTGGADSLECLLTRMGISAGEYVAGASPAGHVHIFNSGHPELNSMVGAPTSSAAGGLWDTPDDLAKNDVVLLSCEGAETSGAVPANLETYLNAGGRVLASHFHYAWFIGSVSGGYAAPSDWGANLAAWDTTAGAVTSGAVGGVVQTSLTSGGTFSKGVAFGQFLTAAHALSTTIGTTTVASPELPIVAPRYNASVTTQKPSQSWLQVDTATDSNGAVAPTLAFSFDTPVVLDGGAGPACGRALFTDLHVGGASYDGVNCTSSGGGGPGGSGCPTGHAAAAPPPAGCDTTHALSPQEAALEFALFDLSSCALPDTQPVPTDAGLP